MVKHKAGEKTGFLITDSRIIGQGGRLFGTICFASGTHIYNIIDLWNQCFFRGQIKICIFNKNNNNDRVRKKPTRQEQRERLNIPGRVARNKTEEWPREGFSGWGLQLSRYFMVLKKLGTVPLTSPKTVPPAPAALSSLVWTSHSNAGLVPPRPLGAAGVHRERGRGQPMPWQPTIAKWNTTALYCIVYGNGRTEKGFDPFGFEYFNAE